MNIEELENHVTQLGNHAQVVNEALDRWSKEKVDRGVMPPHSRLQTSDGMWFAECLDSYHRSPDPGLLSAVGVAWTAYIWSEIRKCNTGTHKGMPSPIYVVQADVDPSLEAPTTLWLGIKPHGDDSITDEHISWIRVESVNEAARYAWENWHATQGHAVRSMVAHELSVSHAQRKQSHR